MASSSNSGTSSSSGSSSMSGKSTLKKKLPASWVMLKCEFSAPMLSLHLFVPRTADSNPKDSADSKDSDKSNSIETELSVLSVEGFQLTFFQRAYDRYIPLLLSWFLWLT